MSVCLCVFFNLFVFCGMPGDNLSIISVLVPSTQKQELVTARSSVKSGCHR